MADFAESMTIAQVDLWTYCYTWIKEDLASDDVELEIKQNCSYEELLESLEKHCFDVDRVFNHFEDYPCSTITLKEEY